MPRKKNTPQEPAKHLPAIAVANGLVDTGSGFEGQYDNVQATIDGLGVFKLPPELKKSKLLTLTQHGKAIMVTAAAIVDHIEERKGSQGRPKAPLIHYLPAPKGWRKEGKRNPVYTKIVSHVEHDQRPIEQQLEESDALVRVSRNGEGVKGLSYWQTCKQAGSADRVWLKYPVARCELRLRTEVSAEYAQHMTVLAESYPFREDSRPLFDGERWDFTNRVLYTGLQPKCKPLKGGTYTTWLRLWSRGFADLDEPLQSDPWAIANKIRTGGKYGFYWFATIVQFPERRLPYIFWYSDQNAGKSIIHESIHAHLFDCSSADLHLSGDKFIANLADSPLAYIEETDLSKGKGASQKIRQLVTAGRLSKRPMFQDQVEVTSFLHFIQCSNKLESLPIPWGCTRTICLGVDVLKPATAAENAQLAADMAAIEEDKSLSDEEKCKQGAARIAKVPADTLIPRAILDRQLAREAPYLLHALREDKLPSIVDRLALPAIETDLKRQIMLADVPDLVVEIVDWATAKGKPFTWTGTAKELFKQTGSRSEADRRKVVNACNHESGTKYLADHGVVVTFPKEHTENGKLVAVTFTPKEAN